MQSLKIGQKLVSVQPNMFINFRIINLQHPGLENNYRTLRNNKITKFRIGRKNNTRKIQNAM